MLQLPSGLDWKDSVYVVSLLWAEAANWQSSSAMSWTIRFMVAKFSVYFTSTFLLSCM
jgi:hypothetical protein